jgi:arabinogalactan oligomer/maltooligosaccharide transport system substrate-binding protein
LLEALGEENLGVAVLPSGPNQRPAGPTLQVSAFVFSRVASLQETNRALELVKFMTNLQQQTRLTIQPIGRLPAHSQIRFRQTLSPLVTELAAQSRTAAPVAFEYRPIWNRLVRGQTEVNDLYLQGLSGVLPSHQVVEQISARIVSTFNLELESASPELLCPVLEPGAEHEVTLWHSEENEDATTLALLARNFSELCPGITLQLIAQNSDDIETRYRRAALAGNGPDMLLASSRLAARLAAGGLIEDLSEYVDINYLQQFIPEAEAALRYNGRLYGLPESVSVQALYYNTNLVDDPLLNLNEVQIRVSGERQFALPVSFFLGYWGFGAFGGIGFDRETGHILNSDGLMNWLAWLESAQNQPGMVITTNFDQAESLFARGEAAYFISGPGSLSRLRRELGEENFRVALLPAGPGGPGSPILQVQGLMVNRNSPPTATTIAVAFAKYLVSPASQQVMLRTGTHVSPLVTVDLSEHPRLNSFREQAKVSAVVPETSYFAGVEQAGDELFEAVLQGGEDLPESIETFMEAVTRTTDGQVMEN